MPGGENRGIKGWFSSYFQLPARKMLDMFSWLPKIEFVCEAFVNRAPRARRAGRPEEMPPGVLLEPPNPCTVVANVSLEPA